ncbi:histidine phosphatase family protein [Roseobacter weihaiensis]|uniref:histidine phosphatase family protein n=1 Tax=Roseobacter weihaiensis TaxID=2763262 RepID=UPI001D0A8CF6|nr:histidine phosphatase family protein [Roseobacter sp. H9]
MMPSSELRRDPGLPSSLKILGAACLAALTLPAQAQANAEMDPPALVDALKGGGHVVFIRHATTEKDYADQIEAVMGDCSTQRVLSEAGWAEAKAIGAAFARLDIPVGDVISSEYCRAWQTADLAFGTFEKNADLNFEPAETYSEAQLAAMSERMSPHLSTVPQEANTILVGHDDPFEAATGIYPEPMGITFVLEPQEDGTFEILGSIAPDAWADLP